MTKQRIPGSTLSELRRRLLRWYDRHQRDLPWRKEPSLYRTVVSEFMLQQTQVATVLPYFDRWLRTFPDFEALATAPESAVLKQWEGLGYYARARNLHRLARHLASTENPPHSYQDWLKLPGVGPYTAAAISSIAFRQRQAVVDGNVVRVLTRLFRDQTRYNDSAAAVEACRPRADALLAPRRPGDFNQAIMELGALICRPRQPACLLCPWQKDCLANHYGDPEQYPVVQKKRRLHKQVERAFLFDPNRSATGSVLLEKIPVSAKRLAGQYEIPHWPRGIKSTGDPLLVKNRGIANEQFRESIYQAPKGWLPPPDSDSLQWVSLLELDDITMPGPHRRWLKTLLINCTSADQSMASEARFAPCCSTEKKLGKRRYCASSVKRSPPLRTR